MDDWIIFHEPIDTYDYDGAGLYGPEDCDEDNPTRLCYGCKFETRCYGSRSF